MTWSKSLLRLLRYYRLVTNGIKNAVLKGYRKGLDSTFFEEDEFGQLDLSMSLQPESG